MEVFNVDQLIQEAFDNAPVEVNQKLVDSVVQVLQKASGQFDAMKKSMERLAAENEELRRDNAQLKQFLHGRPIYNF
ncbi:MAG: hypothetical protein J7539_13285 [Niabella sp.]|nr:hypothetical protein [Niabella sp.]